MQPDPCRVLIVAHTHPRLTEGGGEIVAYETFRRLRDAPGFAATWLSHDAGQLTVRSGSPFSQPFGADEYFYSGRSFDHLLFANPDPNFAPAFVALLRRLRPEIVHFHHFIGLGVEALALVRQALPAARVFLTLHEYLLICHHHGQMVTHPALELCTAASPQSCHRCFPEHPPAAFFLRELWLKRFLAAVDLFICPSHFLAGRFRAWGLPAERLRVIENPLPAMEPPAEAAAGRSIPRIGFFGQISVLKGLGVLFAAARLLADRGWPGVIELHGRQEAQPAALQGPLNELLAKIPPNILIRGGYPNGQVAALMAACDAVVVPSIWWENAPVVLREAAAAGIPVIGADLGGLGESLRGMPGGILFSARDPVALAQAILDLPPPGQPRMRRAAAPSRVDALAIYRLPPELPDSRPGAGA